jgi:hypothetical protein
MCTIARFWSVATREVVKISSNDMPRWLPAIVYITEMDRYLVLDDNGLIRLPEFETIRAAKGGAFPAWRDPPADIT